MERRTLVFVGLGIVFAVVAIASVIGIVGNLRDRDASPEAAPAVAVVPAPVPAPDAAAAPIPPVAARVVPLPTKHVDVHALLGKSRAAIGAVLGHAELTDDGASSYDVGKEPNDVTFLVEFDRDRAAWIDILAHETLDADEDRDQVMSWANVSPAVDDLDFADMPGTLVVWGPGFRKRYEERREWAHAITGLMKAMDYDGSAVVTAGVRLTINLTPGDRTCNRAALAQIRDGLGAKELKEAGFDAMQCDLDGAVLKL